MTTRVIADGPPNEPIPFEAYVEAVDPILDLLGLAEADVESLHITRTRVRAKVVVRTRRGRRLHESWAHLSRRVDPDPMVDVDV